ncbi:MAG: hypothetical protein ACSLE2_11660 [Lysobacterales bacterium]
MVAVEHGNGYFAIMPSQLPQRGRERLEAVLDVTSVDPLTMLPAILQTPGLAHAGSALIDPVAGLRVAGGAVSDCWDRAAG